jgi:predicted O-linked N-acetylglucosamine transferase (SPINDLY family)
MIRARYCNVLRRHSSDDLALHRAAAGMPSDGLLLCNFNQVFKLDPAMFDLWLNITASAPGSSLVLLRYPPESERYLRATMRTKVSH